MEGHKTMKMLENILPDGLRDPKTAAARESLWAYSRLMDNAFYRDDRPHLITLADTLQKGVERRLLAPNGKICRRIAISEPPRHGKSYTLTMFNQWALGRNPKEKIINVSYNDVLSTRFARGVRDGISATRIDPDRRVFADVFPGVKIKYGDAAMDLWSLEGSYFSFLAASFGSTVTGIGCSIMIIDDPIKSSVEAYNERILDEKWDYYRNTLRSRIEEDGILIVVMTRWARKDLVGRLLDAEPGEWVELRHPACLDIDKRVMLCPSILSYENWAKIKSVVADDIFAANYQQEPIDAKGRLYQGFTEYAPIELPTTGRVIAYVDTADTGADYLCALVGRESDGRGYMLDVVYTDEPMERTEIMVCDMLYNAACSVCVIESNNGGRGFARNVERLLWERHRWRKTQIIWHNQRQNKEARILTEAAYIERNILMPEGWAQRWPQYHAAMTGHQRKGRNAHDDAPDATTGFAETIQTGVRARSKFYSGKGARR